MQNSEPRQKLLSNFPSKDAGHRPAFCKHLASKNQLPGFYICGILVENGLTKSDLTSKATRNPWYLFSFVLCSA